MKKKEKNHFFYFIVIRQFLFMWFKFLPLIFLDCKLSDLQICSEISLRLFNSFVFSIFTSSRYSMYLSLRSYWESTWKFVMISRSMSENSQSSNMKKKKTFSCLIKTSIGCFWALNYLLIGAVYVFDSN